MILKIVVVLIAVIALVILTKWTDKKGWTAFYKEGTGGAMLSGAMSTIDQMLFEERKAAIEYRKEEKTEQQENGQDYTDPHL